MLDAVLCDVRYNRAMRSKPVIIDGQPIDGPKLAKELGLVPWPVVRMRLNRGWNVHDAFNQPVHVAGQPAPSDAGKAAWHDAERIRHEAAAKRHRMLRDAALRRIDDARTREVAIVEREVLAGEGEI